MAIYPTFVVLAPFVVLGEAVVVVPVPSQMVGIVSILTLSSGSATQGT